MRKQVSKRSAAYLTSKMGENYFTQKIAPIVLNFWYQVFLPKKFGEIRRKTSLIFMRVLRVDSKPVQTGFKEFRYYSLSVLDC